MALQTGLRNRLRQMLSTIDDDGSLGPRLTGDAVRLWNRVRRFSQNYLAGQTLDDESLELACYALQLPARQARGVMVSGRLGKTNLRDRCEQAAELLVSLMGTEVEEPLLDRATRLLQELPHRSPASNEARLLADVVNLDDFGVTGLVIQTIQMALNGDGVADLLVAADKREQYGYWDARLKDGFHFEAIRKLARARLEGARQMILLLAQEQAEDQP